MNPTFPVQSLSDRLQTEGSAVAFVMSNRLFFLQNGYSSNIFARVAENWRRIHIDGSIVA